MTTITAPDDIRYVQLAALKAAVKLEGLGMRRSRKPSARAIAIREFKLRPLTKTPAIITAIEEEMQRLYEKKHGAAS